MLRLKYYTGIGIIGLMLLYLLIFSCRRLLFIKEGNVKITVKYKAHKAEDLTIYWDDGTHFSQDKHKTHATDTLERNYVFEIRQPKEIAKLRVDPADTFSNATLYELSISGTKIPYTINRFDTFETSGLKVLKTSNGYLLQRKPDNFDPYMIINIPEKSMTVFPVYSTEDIIVIILCFLLTILSIYIIIQKKIFNAFLYELPFYQQSLLFVFFGIITCYWTDTIFEYYSPPPSIENRRLSKKPDIDTLRYNPEYYCNSFNAWFCDYFPFRQKIVYSNSLLKVGLFNISPMPDQLIIGKDFQFFTANSFVQDDFTGKKIFTENELNILNLCLQGKWKYMRAHGMDFYFIMPPTKQFVYHNYMPDFYQAQEGALSLGQQLRNRLQLDSINFYINVSDSLKDYFELHPDKKVFYKYDIHWSEWGAFKAYQILMNRIYKDHPEYGSPLKENEVKVDTFYDEEADLAKLIVLNKKLKREKYNITPIKKDSITEVSAGDQYTPVFIDHNPAAKGRLLVFRDSYSEEWRRLIAHHFNESIFIWDHKMDTKTIEKYKPDIVIQENCEMLILYLFEQLIIDKDA